MTSSELKMLFLDYFSRKNASSVPEMLETGVKLYFDTHGTSVKIVFTAISLMNIQEYSKEHPSD